MAGFLSQGYFFAWLGAGIIILAGLCLAELSKRHLARTGLARSPILAMFPAIALFLIYDHYKHPLTLSLAASLGLLLSLAFERLPIHRIPARVVVYALLAAVGFWLGGAGTLLVFAAMTMVYGALVHRDWVSTALALPIGAAVIWILAKYVFLIPVHQALLTLTPWSPSATTGMGTFLRILTSLLFVFVPALVALVLVVRSTVGSRAGPAKTKAKARRAPRQRKKVPPTALAGPARAVLPVVLMALGLYFSYDALRKPYVLSNYYARRKQWDKIIELGHRLKNKSNIFVNHDIIRAMYHTGRLPNDLFRYPLAPDAILLTHEKKESDLTEWKLSDIFLELGRVNMAQKLASELLSTKGPMGVALEELAWISIIKEQPDTARVYLNALKKNLLYHREAESLLHGLDSGFTPEQVAYIDRIRSSMSNQETAITGGEPLDETLSALLKRNPHNKMAFEYLMTCYLVTGRVDKIVENMGRLPELGYERIPTLYEEAILIYYGSQGKTVDLGKFNIDPETLRRYEAFVQTSRAMQTAPPQTTMVELVRRGFGTSYFFYYSYGKVGLM